MELHLPYLTLREVGSASTSFGCSETHRNTRPWADMTFLDRYTRELGLKGRSIFAAHATIVVSGWNSSKFTALSFIEPGPDVRSAEEQDDSADEDEDLDCNESPEPELLPEDTEDQFATYGWQTFHRLHDRRWDPRVCFLRAVQIKIKVALQEYDYLIEHLCHVVDWVRCFILPVSLSLPLIDRDRFIPCHKYIAYTERREAPLSSRVVRVCSSYYKSTHQASRSSSRDQSSMEQVQWRTW